MHFSPQPRDYPYSDIARRIAEMWAELFDDVDLTVGVDDDFFALGGSSLMAVSLVAMLGDAFGVSLRLVAVVDNPTLGGLAEHIAGLTGGGAGDEALEGGVL